MAGLAGAGTITQTVRYHFAEHGTGFNAYTKFDPALGTLDAVNYSFTGTAGSSFFQFTNTSTSTVTFGSNVTFTVRTLAGQKTFTMDYTDTLPGHGLAIHQLTGSYSFNTSFNSPGGLAQWIGQGYYFGQDYDLTLARGTASADDAAINVAAFPSFFFDGMETITYVYSPADAGTVPEPASLATAATGLLAVLGYSWRRRRIGRP